VEGGCHWDWWKPMKKSTRHMNNAISTVQWQSIMSMVPWGVAMHALHAGFEEEDALLRHLESFLQQPYGSSNEL